MKSCDHTSVGILVFSDHEKILLIERARPPFGYAPPAGHVDSHGNFEDAAKVELEEEVGLTVCSLKLITEGRLENRCRRLGGTWHYWKIFSAKVSGNPIPNIIEAKKVIFVSPVELQEMANRTLKNEPGTKIEPAWLYWFVKLKLIRAPISEISKIINLTFI